MNLYVKQVKILAAIGLMLIATVFLTVAFTPLGEQRVFRGSAKIESETMAASQEKLFLIELNTATAEQLESVPGIGEKTAAKIIAYREEIGAFTDLEQLLKVDGIGEKTFEQIKEYFTL